MGTIEDLANMDITPSDSCAEKAKPVTEKSVTGFIIKTVLLIRPPLHSNSCSASFSWSISSVVLTPMRRMTESGGHQP